MRSSYPLLASDLFRLLGADHRSRLRLMQSPALGMVVRAGMADRENRGSAGHQHRQAIYHVCEQSPPAVAWGWQAA